MSASPEFRRPPGQTIGSRPLAADAPCAGRALPGTAYTSETLFAWERENIFKAGWTAVGRTDEFAMRGSQTALETSGRNILLAGTGNDANAFVNACRHRGHELVFQGCQVRRAQIWCPYHGWVYGLDGTLRRAPRFEETAERERVGMGLLPVRTAQWNGWTFVNLSGNAPDLTDSLGNLTGILSPYNLAKLRSVGKTEYQVKANWKLLVENYLECYHCPSTHPQLSSVQRTVNGEAFKSTGMWLGGAFDLKNSADSASLDGSGPNWTFPDLDEDRARQVCYYAVLPGLFITTMHDYTVTHRLEPQAVDQTRVVCEWLMADELLNTPGFDHAYAVEFWETTNAQDWRACESTQRGVSDERYIPGPLAPDEDEVRVFLRALSDAYERDAPLRPLWCEEVR